MAESREPMLCGVAGEKGVGKTYTSNKIANDYVKVQRRPVVIFDVNMEDAYRDYRTIYPPDVAKLYDAKTRKRIPEIRRVIPYIEKTVRGKKKWVEMGIKEKMNTLVYLLKNFRGGLLILEDYTNYVTNSGIKDIVSELIKHRHRDQDIILHVQSLAKLDPTLYQNMNLTRVHHQKDDIERYKEKIPNLELFTIAKILVDNRYHRGVESGNRDDKSYYIHISDKHRLYGDINEKEFEIACRTYLRRNAWEMKNQMEDLREEGYKGKDIEDAARQRFVKQCKMKYLGIK